MMSNWVTAKERSSYHFNPLRQDLESDVITRLGAVVPEDDWAPAIEQVIKDAQPATWATRGYKGQGVPPPTEDLMAEEYDLTSHGMNKDMSITHMSWAVPPAFQSILDSFALEDCMARIHVQMPGEVWNLHIDKLQKWCPEDPDRVVRIFVQLTDWCPGQFYQFGNWNWTQWRAGDMATFDWRNIPHSTANAGYDPRVTLQLTGVKTSITEQMLNWLQNK
jgi:hypothetical protein